MGTNYYLLSPEDCPHCASKFIPTHTYDYKIHIGKSSYGWSFSFKGYKNHCDIEDITSESEWRKYIKKAIKNGQYIINEDDEKIDPEKFWEMVEEKKGGHNHTTYCVKELPDDFYKFKNWLDNKGNSFSEGEFS